MKLVCVRTARLWGMGAILLAGLVYSVFALTLPTKQVYASSCDCTEAHQDAIEICSGQGGLQHFGCPVGAQQNEFFVQCNNGFNTVVNCSF